MPPSAHRGGSSAKKAWRLVNLTNTRKYNVGVTGEPARRGGTNHFHVIDGRESVGPDLIVAWQTVDRRVKVN